jgi:plasmid segregation protein ParM
MKPTVFAFDDGYGENKLTNGEQMFVIPNLQTKYRPRPMNDFNSSTPNPLDFIVSEINGEKFVVGKGVEEIDSNIEWIGGSNKHLDLGFPIIMKTCLGMLAKEDNISVDKLVMGLPVKEYRKEERLNQLKQLVLNKTHSVKLEYADGTKTIKNIRINNLDIKMQPFGSLCDAVLDKNGEFIDYQTAKDYNVVVDIGARTLNILTAREMLEVPDLSTNTNHGMFFAYDMINEYLQHNGKPTIPTGQLPTVARKGKVGNDDISQQVSMSYEILANQIHAIIDKMFVNHWALVNKVIFTGGGATVLKKHLTRLFADKHIMFMSQESNARGLHKFGMRKAKSQSKSVTKVG